jgi:hypothetical protein
MRLEIEKKGPRRRKIDARQGGDREACRSIRAARNSFSIDDGHENANPNPNPNQGQSAREDDEQNKKV